MPQNLTNFDGAMKDNYGPGLKNAVNNMNAVVTEVGFNDQDIIGRKAVWSIHSGPSTSTGSRAEAAVLPTADRQRYVEVNDSLKYTYHTLKVTGQAIALSRSDVGSFVRALESEMDQGQKDITRDYARQIFGQALTDGTNLQSGVLLTLSADPGTGTTWTVANATTSEMRYLFKGLSFMVINPADGTARAGGPYFVATVNQAAKTFTTTAAANAAIASADYIVRGDASANSFGAEINGLRHLLNPTDKYAGIDPATEPTWAPVAVGSSTTQISELIFSQAEDIVDTDGDGAGAELLFITAYSQAQKLATILQAQKRYDGRDVTLKGGFKGVQIANGVMIRDRFCPDTFAAGVNRDELSRFVGLDWSWDPTGGSVLYKALDGSDAVEARYLTYHQFVTTNRNSHVQITLAVPALG
jgi:hypothetical protein